MSALHLDGGTHTIVILDDAVQCAGCGRMAAVLVNRDGRTPCSGCPGEERERQEREAEWMQGLVWMVA